jgi:hypothetical protein
VRGIKDLAAESAIITVGHPAYWGYPALGVLEEGWAAGGARHGQLPGTCVTRLRGAVTRPPGVLEEGWAAQGARHGQLPGTCVTRLGGNISLSVTRLRGAA